MTKAMAVVSIYRSRSIEKTTFPYPLLLWLKFDVIHIETYDDFNLFECSM